MLKREATFNWATDARGNRYIDQNVVTLDPGQIYAKQAGTEQGMDVYGNLLWSRAYDFGLTVRSLHTVLEVTHSRASDILHKPVNKQGTGPPFGWVRAAWPYGSGAFLDWPPATTAARPGLGHNLRCPKRPAADVRFRAHARAAQPKPRSYVVGPSSRAAVIHPPGALLMGLQ